MVSISKVCVASLMLSLGLPGAAAAKKVQDPIPCSELAARYEARDVAIASATLVRDHQLEVGQHRAALPVPAGSGP